MQLVKTDGREFNLQPRNFEEAMKYAEMIAKSSFAPKDYQGKAAEVLIAIQMGQEIGLKPLQSLQNISIVNGRPTLWGDAALGLVRAHPDFEYINEYEENNTAFCEVKRKREPACIRSFSKDDAKNANLINKEGAWRNYPKRMLQMRARGFALRDSFTDALKGLSIREEVEDYSDEWRDITPTDKVASVKKIVSKPSQPPLAVCNEQESPHRLDFSEVESMIMKSNTIAELKSNGTKAKEFDGTLEQIEKLRDFYEIRLNELKEDIQPDGDQL